MQLKIQNGAVDLSGEPILRQINFEINTASKIGIVGRNGCGKTTLLRLLAGDLQLARIDGVESSFTVSGKPEIGMLRQMSFRDDRVTMVDELRSAYSDILAMKARLDELQQAMERSQEEETIRDYTALLERFTNAGGFYFEKEYEAAIRHFGFTDEEKHRPLSEFSGGQRTKIAFLKLLLSKPDLLLLDEPTNHLDVEAVAWLEEYLAAYKKAVVIVSHDRMFLDRTVGVIYEIERGKTSRYVGNYSDFVLQKQAQRERDAKLYEAQQKEIARLNEIVTRFKYKPTKAAMAQSKLKQLERMERIEPPERSDRRKFHAAFEPAMQSAKDVLSVRELQIGFTAPLATVSFEIKRGERVGVIGGNGLGKSTLLKTLVGRLPALGGVYRFGDSLKIGYFDQQMAQISGSETVLADFSAAYPELNDFEARSALGAFLFSGEDVFKTLDMLSGGERVRLALCKLFRARPNLLILDEPTNHMDIIGKETLEEMLLGYSGTLLFVSHDRYFTKKLADRLLVFESGQTRWYEYGYTQYEQAHAAPAAAAETPHEPPRAKKKGFTTPAKERDRRARELKKAEEQVALLEERLNGLREELGWDENISNYLRLAELQEEISAAELELDAAMNRWEALALQQEEE